MEHLGLAFVEGVETVVGGGRRDWMIVEGVSARVGDSSTVDRGAEIVVNWGRVRGMMVEGSGSQAYWDSSAKGFRP